jgi:TRAP-type C4-dicarboxylate transport system permease small subunit
MIKIVRDNLHLAVVTMGLLVLFGVFISVLIQISARHIIQVPVLWTDEIAKICFVWSVYLGAILVVNDDELIKLDISSNFLPRRFQMILKVLFNIIALIVAIYAIPGSIRLVSSNLNYRFSFTELPYAYLYFAGSVFFFALAVVSIAKLVRRRANNREERSM